MFLIRGLNNLNYFKEKFQDQKLVTTIGNFDGLHKGHKEIIKNMKTAAKSLEAKTLVVFTEPHAKEFFSSDKDIKDRPTRISPWRDKYMRLKASGIDFAFYLKFNKALQTMTPESFIEDVLETFNISQLMIGDDFRFGNQREGDFEMLVKWGEKKHINILKHETFEISNRRVSSSWVREALSKGDFDLAKKLLGRPYTFSGKVVKGNQLGRTIGFPTANIWLPKNNLPIRGVFSVKIQIDGSIMKGIANMGVRPTVGGTHPVLEVHVFDLERDLYGKRMDVEFVSKIRDEKKFDNLEELKSQISLDVEEAKKILEK